MKKTIAYSMKIGKKNKIIAFAQVTQMSLSRALSLNNS
jgi:hypothetical protein